MARMTVETTRTKEDVVFAYATQLMSLLVLTAHVYPGTGCVMELMIVLMEVMKLLIVDLNVPLSRRLVDLLISRVIMGIALMQFLNATRKMTVVIIAMKETAQSQLVHPRSFAAKTTDVFLLSLSAIWKTTAEI